MKARMHKAQFKLIADTLGKAFVKADLNASQRSTLSNAFADALANTNEAFDRIRFLQACTDAQKEQGG